MNEILNLIFDGKIEEATSKLLPFLEENPDDPNAWYGMGLIQQKRQDFQWAVESYRKAFTLAPHPEALYEYGRLLRGNANPDLNTPKAVYIGIPHYGHSEPAFEESLDAMVAAIKPEHNIDWMSCRCEGSRITSNRNRLVQDAIKKNATHILFIDSDMDFPADSIHRLLGHNKDIVCATTCKRGDETGTPIGQAVDDGDGKEVKRVSTGTGQLAEMQLVGACFMLINLDIFDKLQHPVFYEPPEYSIGDALGEDITFCKIVRQAGFKVWLDVDLSFQLGHWGKKRYSIKPVG